VILSDRLKFIRNSEDIMKKIITVTAIIMLTGCAGTASEFQCTGSATDRCMTMEQANRLAREKTVKNSPAARTPVSSAGKTGSAALPAVVFPVSQVAPAAVKKIPATPSGDGVTETSRKKPAQQNKAMVLPEDDLMAGRRSEHTASLWIAPWTDEAQVLHQPGRLWFVVQPGQWQLQSSGDR
jgi:conjugal transfer pilus assembly protein TraV